MKCSRRKSVSLRYLLSVLALGGGAPAVVEAADVNWSRTAVNGPGNWTDGANWAGGAVPTAADTGRINNGGTVVVDSAVTAGRVLMGAAANNTGTLNIASGGALHLELTSAVQFSGGEGSNTTINVTGGSFNYGAITAVDLGRMGTSTLNVNGGSFSVGGTLRLGIFERNAQGTINLSSGTINVGANLALLFASTNAGTLTQQPKGDLIQTGGTVNVVGATSIGFSSAIRGTSVYEIGNATLNSGTMYIGGGDSGTLRITNSAANINLKSSLTLGSQARVEAVAGSRIKFTEPTGFLVADANSPYLNQNLYWYSSMSVANSANVAGLANTTLEFAGGDLAGANIGMFEVSATDMGAVEAGFANNFTLGGLDVGNGAKVGNIKLGNLHLNGAAEGSPAQALYVNALNVTAGSTLDLNGLNLYYKSGSILGTVVNGTPILVGGAVDDADFNGDGKVDGDDFLVWQRGFGAGTTPAEGDANNDNLVNAADLEIWKTQFGQVGAAPAVGAVPEPSALLLGALAALGTAGARRRRR